MTPADISIVIPALDEAASIAACIQSARDAGAQQIIVGDGGSSDDTVMIADQAGAKVVTSPPGRGTQQNHAAKYATGQVLLFLHADNRLDSNCLSQICDVKDPAWGAFRQQIDSARFVYRMLEYGNAARVQWRQMVFGDQAIFVRRDLFDHVGGFPNEPLMEDVALSRALRAISKPVLLPGRVTISCRRWEKRGVIRQTLLNWRIQIAHRLGVSPKRLARWYR